MLKYFEGLENVIEVILYAIAGLLILLVLLLIFSPTTKLKIVLAQDDKTKSDAAAVAQWERKWNGDHPFRTVKVEFFAPPEACRVSPAYSDTDCTLENYIARASNRPESNPKIIDIVEVDSPWIATIGDHLVTLNECSSQDSAGFVSGIMWRLRELWSQALFRFNSSDSDKTRACADVKELTKHFPLIVERGKTERKLKGIPLFTTVGLLFYNTKLLTENQMPPKTWSELEHIARSFKKDNRDKFGFIWQGAPYEGLMCNFAEWMGDSWIVNPSVLRQPDLARCVMPRSTIEKWMRTLKMVRSWLKDANGVSISPPDVLKYKETETFEKYKKNDTLFMRAWSRTYADVKALTDVKTSIALIPNASAGSADSQHGTIGPWYLAITRRSKNKDIAMDLIKHLTSEEIQVKRAAEKYLLPTRKEAYTQLERPGLKEIDELLQEHNGKKLVDVVQDGVVERPIKLFGPCYPEFALHFEKTVNELLNVGEQEFERSASMKLKEVGERTCPCLKQLMVDTQGID